MKYMTKSELNRQKLGKPYILKDSEFVFYNWQSRLLITVVHAFSKHHKLYISSKNRLQWVYMQDISPCWITSYQ
jgi:hypothetical protein